MVFNSFTFFALLTVAIFVSRAQWTWSARKAVLLALSYLFYAAWNPPFVLVLVFSTVADWHLAKWIFGAKSNARRRRMMVCSLVVNLGLLGYFKYGGFALTSLQQCLASVGVPFAVPEWSVVLPVGISFYTFQTLSYTIDVFRGKTAPWNSFLDYALYVTFFPQLVAGPIVRATDFLPQCEQCRRATREGLRWGALLIGVGLFNKMVIADQMMAPIVEAVYDGPSATLDGLSAWAGTLAFSIQIFCDFAGYSSCAIGSGWCLGFWFPDNFNCPYAAMGFSDFWRRWHISLSTWLRDYLYISLGGNRRSTTRTAVNLMLTMLLGGLWHGAAWTFVAWGGMHAIFLMLERMMRQASGLRRVREAKWAGPAAAVGTYLCVCLTWVFFRAGDFKVAMDILAAMFGCGGGGGVPVLSLTNVGIASLGCVGTLCVHWVTRDMSLAQVVSAIPPWLRVCLGGLMILLVAMSFTGEDRAFIYFQF